MLYCGTFDLYLVEAVLFQFHNFQLKVSSQSVLVKLDSSCEPVDVGHLHVVDQGVAVLPGVVAGAAEGRHVDDLGGKCR